MGILTDLFISFLVLVVCQIVCTSVLVYALTKGHILVSRQDGGLYLSLTSQIMTWTLFAATFALFVATQQLMYLMLQATFLTLFTSYTQTS